VGDIRAEGAVVVGGSIRMVMECNSQDRDGETYQ
jgi:hypothetical protein